MRASNISFTQYDLQELRRALRATIPKCCSIPTLNKNSTSDEIIDAVNFLEIQGKYNQKIKNRRRYEEI